MNIFEIVAATFSSKLPDGRFLFRPWGPVGLCYLLTARQRTGRASVQLAYYALAFLMMSVLPDVPALNWATEFFLAAFVAINYLLFWLFSIGLSTTEKPARFTPSKSAQPWRPTPGHSAVPYSGYSRSVQGSWHLLAGFRPCSPQGRA